MCRNLKQIMTTPGKSPEINPWRFLDRSSGPPFSGRCVSTHSYQRVKRCKESSFHTLDWKKRHVQMIEKQCTSRDWNSYCKISTRIKPYNPFCFPSTVSWEIQPKSGAVSTVEKTLRSRARISSKDGKWQILVLPRVQVAGTGYGGSACTTQEFGPPQGCASTGSSVPGWPIRRTKTSLFLAEFGLLKIPKSQKGLGKLKRHDKGMPISSSLKASLLQSNRKGIM